MVGQMFEKETAAKLLVEAKELEERASAEAALAVGADIAAQLAGIQLEAIPQKTLLRR